MALDERSVCIQKWVSTRKVVQNFIPGTLSKMEVNPRIYARIHSIPAPQISTTPKDMSCRGQHWQVWQEHEWHALWPLYCRNEILNRGPNFGKLLSSGLNGTQSCTCPIIPDSQIVCGIQLMRVWDFGQGVLDGKSRIGISSAKCHQVVTDLVWGPGALSWVAKKQVYINSWGRVSPRANRPKWGIAG